MGSTYVHLPKWMRRSPDLYIHAAVWWAITIGFVVAIRAALWQRAIMFAMGAFAQSFFEYASHAWAFHGPMWDMHKGHHVKPGDTSRLLVPFMYSIPCGIFEYLLVGSIIGFWLVTGLSAGAAFWYILFEWIHYSCHQPQLQGILKFFPGYAEMRHAHKVHHYEDREPLYTGYGFTTLFWDRVFGTAEPETAPAAESAKSS